MLFSVAALLLGVSGIARCQTTAAKPPGLSHLYFCNATLGTPVSVGAGPRGNRTVIPITGGTFSGPLLSGKILGIGADWSVIDTNGTFSADTRYQLQTNDGANIFITTAGPAQPDGTLHLRATFETGSKEYWWLNNIIAIGILKPGNGWVGIDMWQMTSPLAVDQTEPDG